MSSAFHLHIGGAGIRIGDMLWKLYDQEHNDTSQKNYIYQQIQENYHPYSLFLDLDDQIIQEVQANNKQIKYKKIHFFMEKKEEQFILDQKHLDGIYPFKLKKKLGNKQKLWIDQMNL